MNNRFEVHHFPVNYAVIDTLVTGELGQDNVDEKGHWIVAINPDRLFIESIAQTLNQAYIKGMGETWTGEINTLIGVLG